MKHNPHSPPTFLFEQVFDEPNSGGGTAWNNSVSRRSFLKRTGGATAATFVAWHITGHDARAEEKKEEKKEGDSANGETTVPVNSHVYRVTVQKQRKKRKVGASDEEWANEGTATISLEAGSDGDMPEPEKPSPPQGFPVERGWKENTNEVLEKLKSTLPAEGAVDPTYNPDIGGESSSTNDGDGPAGDGWRWTNQVRTKIIREKVPYTMNYRFSEK